MLPQIVQAATKGPFILSKKLRKELTTKCKCSRSKAEPGCKHTYWKYSIDLDPEIIPGGTVGLGQKLKAAIVCTPPNTHASICEKLAGAGVYVLCKKPVVLDHGEATKMIQ
ncbi:MAG: Gfo/Idh/MocA family oxidoreductase [Pirellula sp.]